MVICKTRKKLKKEMQNVDKVYRQYWPNATQSLSTQAPKGWKNSFKFKNLKSQKEKVVQKYNDHKKDCVAC